MSEEKHNVNTFRDDVPRVGESWDPEKYQPTGRKKFSYSKFHIDEVCNALQTSIRRNIPEESIQWVLELARTDDRIKKSCWKKLLTSALEDIGPSSPRAVLNVWNLYKKSINKNYDEMEALASAAEMLSMEPKSRLNINAYEYTCRFYGKDRIVVTPAETLLENLKRNLVEKNCYKAIIDCHELFQTKEKVSNKLAYRQAWKVLIDVCGEYAQALSEIALSKNWKNIYMKTRLLHIHIIHLWCYGKVPFRNNIDCKITELSKEYNKKHKNRENLIGMPDYAICNLTEQGREICRTIMFYYQYTTQLLKENEEWRELSDDYLNKTNRFYLIAKNDGELELKIQDK